MASKILTKPSISIAEKQINKPSRPSRPNYNKIHALPLPIKIYPLPPLIPHNPFSVLQIVFTYLLQVVAPPPSHPKILCQAFLSHDTRSVHIINETTTRILWEQGFFGKGSLSRSEPSWQDRERRRKGIGTTETSEEATRRRRAERKEFKEKRARKEREVIEEKLEGEGKSPVVKLSTQLSNTTLNHKPPTTLTGEGAKHNENVSAIAFQKSATEDGTQNFSSNYIHNNADVDTNDNISTNDNVINLEHLQLTSEEAFFLAYGLGILEIRHPRTSEIISIASLFSIFRQNSYFPPCHIFELQPDDPFLLSYTVYHHFRSLGWVVRPGIKFAVDFLLYTRGPVFSHAEFAVMILPAYTDSYWRSTPSIIEETSKRECKSWQWLHSINRVQSQVRKSLLLVYVNVPPPTIISPSPAKGTAKPEKPATQPNPTVDITGLLKQYHIRELTIRRWTPNRSRD